MKIFDDYRFCVWTIVILFVGSVCVVPFATKQISFLAFRMPVTPVLVLFPVLLGIFYCIVESDANPKKVSPEKRQFKRLLKAIVFTAVVVITVAAVIYGVTK